MNHIIKKETAQPATFGNVVDRLFQTNLSRFFDDDLWGFTGIDTPNKVPVNIRETDRTYELDFAAPGLKKQDISLNLAGDLLTISFEQEGQKKEEDKQHRWLRQEFRKASFSRSFHLDDTVDGSKVTARYEDGVLHVSLPKKEQAQSLSRQITIE